MSNDSDVRYTITPCLLVRVAGQIDPADPMRLPADPSGKVLSYTMELFDAIRAGRMFTLPGSSGGHGFHNDLIFAEPGAEQELRAILDRCGINEHMVYCACCSHPFDALRPWEHPGQLCQNCAS